MGKASLNKDLVVIDENLTEIKKNTTKLLHEAKACFAEIDKQVANISQVVSSLPLDVKNQELALMLSGLSSNKLASDDFEKTARKIDKSLTNLMQHTSNVDTTWKTKALKTKANIKTLSSLAKQYKGLIGEGGYQYRRAFLHLFS